MKSVIASQGGESSSLASTVGIIILVLILGSTVYLWRTGYTRPRTAYVMIILLLTALVSLGYWTYSNR